MLKDQPYEIFNNIPLNCWEGICGSKLYLVHTMPEFMVMYDFIMAKQRISCDLESNGFRWFAGDKIVGMSFGVHIHNFYLPVRHEESVLGGRPFEQLNMDVLRPYLQKFFNRKDCFTIWSNGRFDHKFYKADGIEMNTPWHDTLHLGKRVDENMPGALKTASSGWRDMLGLWHKGIVHPDANKDEKSLSEWRGNEAKARRAIYKADLEALYHIEKANLRYQGLKKNELKKILAEHQLKDHRYKHVEKDDIHYGYIPILDMVKYAALDTFLTYKLYEYFLPIVSANPKAADIYKNEIQLSNVLLDSEVNGVYIDVPYVKEVDIKLTKEINEKKEELLNKLGKINVLRKKATKTKPAVWEEDYPNLGSTDQLAIVLQKNGIELTEQTDSGKWKLDNKVLIKLAKKHPICKELLGLRKLEKLHSTYVINLLNSTVDGVLYSGFNAEAAKTGRMSSSGGGSGGINLQNIPGKDKTIRRAFISPPDKDYILFTMDYSQIEVRLTAHFSQDPILMAAYNTGQDVHLKTMCNMFGFDYEECKVIHKDENHERHKEVDDFRKVGKCFHVDTEVLTKSGWKRIVDLAKNEEVLQAIPARDDKNQLGTATLEWVIPTEVFSFHHPSKKLVHLTSEGIDLRVTPDHRMLEFTESGYYQVKTPDKFGKCGHWLGAGHLNDGNLHIDHNLLYLALVVQADGSYEGKRIRLGFTKERKIERMRELLSKFDSNLWFESDFKGGEKWGKRFTLVPELADKVKELLDPDKTLPWSWLNLPYESRLFILNEAKYWDGGQYKKWTKFDFFSVVKKNNDVMQAIASITGRKSSQLKNDVGLSIKNRAHSHSGTVKKQYYDFSDKVACISVPSTFVLVRDGGKPVVCGQTLNFAAVYQVSPSGLSEQIPRPARYAHLSQEEWVQVCAEFLDKYFDVHRDVKKFIIRSNRSVRQNGYFETTFGRVRHLPHYRATKILKDDKKFWMEQSAQRQGTNHGVQGEAADIFKYSVVNVAKFLKKQKAKSKLVNYIHDDFWTYVHKSELHLVPEIKRIAEDWNYRVPLKVDVSYTTTNWADKKSIDVTNMEALMALAG